MQFIFVFLVLIIYAIVKSIPFGVGEIIGYTFVAVIYDASLGGLALLCLVLVLRLFRVFGKADGISLYIRIFFTFFLTVGINAYLISWSLIKLGIEKKNVDIITLMHYPYLWYGALLAAFMYFIPLIFGFVGDGF